MSAIALSFPEVNTTSGIPNGHSWQKRGQILPKKNNFGPYIASGVVQVSDKVSRFSPNRHATSALISEPKPAFPSNSQEKFTFGWEEFTFFFVHSKNRTKNKKIGSSSIPPQGRCQSHNGIRIPPRGTTSAVKKIINRRASYKKKH